MQSKTLKTDLPGGALPVAPSAIAAQGVQAYTYEGFKPLPPPRALDIGEHPGIVADYAHAGNPAGSFDLQLLRRAFRGSYIANKRYDLALATEARAKNHADLIAFGRPFISNPDRSSACG